MHILTRVLILFLCLPALCAAASPFDRLAGEWGGTVDSGNNCAWKVRASLKPGDPDFTGDFSYEGDCSEEAKQAQFTIKRTGASCFSTTVEIGDEEPIPVAGCADKAGNITFKTDAFTGSLTFSKGGNSLTLTVKAEAGSVSGKFRRMARKKKRGAAKGRTKTAGKAKAKSEDSEVMIGGY